MFEILTCHWLQNVKTMQTSLVCLHEQLTPNLSIQHMHVKPVDLQQQQEPPTSITPKQQQTKQHTHTHTHTHTHHTHTHRKNNKTNTTPKHTKTTNK